MTASHILSLSTIHIYYTLNHRLLQMLHSDWLLSHCLFRAVDHGSRESKGKQYGYTAENSRFAEVFIKFS